MRALCYSLCIVYSKVNIGGRVGSNAVVRMFMLGIFFAIVIIDKYGMTFNNFNPTKLSE